ncbi:hypothetical protein RB195_017293 [Necator americanus]|uniref:FLYWCH-type domain-containing protein n=1 Tax=Necator americanus TaxID=51031 RepID=A0ABR1C7P0_NECAM
MNETKPEAPFLEQLLDEVTPTVNSSEGFTDNIVDNINMEEVLNVLNQASAGGLPGISKERLKRQRRGNRMKVYDNGYIFTYDKDSSCGQRSFWRCERKNECPARVHTNPLTNQIIKRLHQHSHEPPNPDELPPWLLFKSEEGTTPPPQPSTDYTQTASPPGACVLLPCPMLPGGSAMQNLGQFIERTEEKLVIAEQEEETVEPPRKRPRKSKNRDSNKPPADVVSVKELFLQHPTEFWELFEATRRMVEFLKGEEGSSTVSCVTSTEMECDTAVAKLLDDLKLSKYKSVFAKFTVDVMRSLSSEELVRLCRNESDAFCIYHSLKIRSSSSLDFSAPVKVFVREMSVAAEDEPLYQMLLLRNKTKDEFLSMLEKRGILDTTVVERFCVPGPGGINVEVSDEVIASWKDESVFQMIITKGMCRLEPATHRRSNKCPKGSVEGDNAETLAGV